MRPMQYTLRTLLILLFLGPPTLAEVHAIIGRKVAEELLPPLTSGWDIAPEAQSLCFTVTPRIIIQEDEDEEKLGIDLSPQPPIFVPTKATHEQRSHDQVQE